MPTPIALLPARALRWLGAMLMTSVALAALAPIASAHEQRNTDDGQYTVVAGWENEPPSVNERNAATIRIMRADTNPAQAVTGAESSLRLRVRYGSQQREIPLRPDSRPGLYRAEFTPSRGGEYQWTLLGTLDGRPINETFDTADGLLESVPDVLFPDPAEDRRQIASAQTDVQAARTQAAVACVIALVSLATAVWAIRPRGRRSRVRLEQMS